MLRNLSQSEFPVEYLVARLLARRADAAATVQVCLEGKAPVPFATDQEIARQLQAERFWLYHQLNSQLRRDLAPIFHFFELNTLVNWLRLRQAKASDSLLSFFLAHSLLSPGFKNALQEEDASVLAERLETLLCARLDQCFSGLATIYKGKGLLYFERRLYQDFFEHIGLSASKTAVRSFFKGLVDQRNILALVKAHSWHEKIALVSGGYLNVNWEKALTDPERAGKVLAKLRWENGLPRGIEELSALEDFLLRRYGLVLRRQACNGTVEQILYCLWQRGIFARNMGLLLYSRLVGGELLTAKVIH